MITAGTPTIECRTLVCILYHFIVQAMGRLCTYGNVNSAVSQLTNSKGAQVRFKISSVYYISKHALLIVQSELS
jgi:hypothetical protein